MMRRRAAAATYFGDPPEAGGEESPRAGRAATATVGVLAAQVLLLRVALGYPGLGRLADVNTVVITSWLPMLLVAVLFAAACGVTIGIPDAATPGTWRVTVVGAALAAVPASTVVVSQLSSGPNRVIVALGLLAVVLAGGLGAVLGRTAARQAWAGTAVLGAALVWWLGQVARRVFIAAAGPRPPAGGQLTDTFLRSAAFTTTWAPALLGATCAVAVILLGVLTWRTGPSGIAVLAVLPAVVWTAAETLAAVPLGGGALLDAPWWTVLCCLAGGALGAGTGWAARTLRPRGA